MSRQTRTIAMLWLAAVGVGLPAVVWSARSAWNARAAVESAGLDHTRVKAQLDELASLSKSRPASTTPLPQQTSAIAERIPSILRAQGLAPSVLGSFAPQGETTIETGGTSLVRRRALLSLNSITLPQLGGFLNVWRTSEPRWVPTAIDLAPMQVSTAQAGSQTGDLPLIVSLTLEGEFAAQGQIDPRAAGQSAAPSNQPRVARPIPTTLQDVMARQSTNSIHAPSAPGGPSR